MKKTRKPSDGINHWNESRKMKEVAQIQIQHDEAPPLGLIPQWLWNELRMKAVNEAIDRYRAKNKPIPPEWENELRDLSFSRSPSQCNDPTVINQFLDHAGHLFWSLGLLYKHALLFDFRECREIYYWTSIHFCYKGRCVQKAKFRMSTLITQLAGFIITLLIIMAVYQIFKLLIIFVL